MVEVLHDRRQRDEPVAVERRKRGRPRKARTVVIHLRVNVDDYDAYCIVANRAGVAVLDVMRHVLHVNAPGKHLQ
jgi:hypothetical protein